MTGPHRRNVPAQGKRIGISVAKDLPWRFWVPGDENVSR